LTTRRAEKSEKDRYKKESEKERKGGGGKRKKAAWTPLNCGGRRRLVWGDHGETPFCRRQKKKRGPIKKEEKGEKERGAHKKTGGGPIKGDSNGKDGTVNRNAEKFGGGTRGRWH